jgi:hypothetical protein
MQPMIILGVLNLLLIIIVGCFNWFSHFKIVGNELFHINEDIKTIISRQEGISEKVSILSQEFSFLKGTVEAITSKKTFKKSKKAKVGNAN